MDNLQEEKLTPPSPELLRASKKEEYLLRREQKEKDRLKRIRQKKIKKITILAVPILLVLGGIFIWLNYLPKEDQSTVQEKPKITVFYSPTCSCCQEYLPYLKRNGFEVEQKPTRDMLSIKEKYQIPPEMESCHTSVIDNYFVEGHMPVEVIKKLLEEKPEIDGITLPGMPAGSPGMGGVKKESFEIHALTNGQMSEFMIVK